ncbi:hypothetical protein [Brevundimonas sp.]|jgi:hypothetical protein|uniref:hypothetical protein n=1 Tax=Brevundimonas sp. TaxID=1871086 RepID=UPI002E0FDDA0|nr:hypothetical protein [Brevundimonas sp.]
MRIDLTRRGFAVLFAGLALWLIAGPVAAAVTVTFYGHEGAQVRGGWLYFPHAYLRLHGTLDTGETVDRAVGFTARSPGPQLLLFSGPGILKEPEPAYLAEGVPYLSVEISDEAFHQITGRIDWWGTPEGSRYNLNKRNCIAFVADVAQRLGLRTPSHETLSPNGFLKDMVGMNPPGSVPGLLPAPTPPPVPAA